MWKLLLKILFSFLMLMALFSGLMATTQYISPVAVTKGVSSFLFGTFEANVLFFSSIFAAAISIPYQIYKGVKRARQGQYENIQDESPRPSTKVIMGKLSAGVGMGYCFGQFASLLITWLLSDAISSSSSKSKVQAIQGVNYGLITLMVIAGYMQTYNHFSTGDASAKEKLKRPFAEPGSQIKEGLSNNNCCNSKSRRLSYGP